MARVLSDAMGLRKIDVRDDCLAAVERDEPETATLPAFAYLFGKEPAPLDMQKLGQPADRRALAGARHPGEQQVAFHRSASIGAWHRLMQCRQPIGPVLPLEPEIVERMLALAERYKYDARVSMLEDREAARLGIPAPFHDMAYACMKFSKR